MKTHKKRDPLEMIRELLEQQTAICQKNLAYRENIDESEMGAFDEQMLQHYKTSTMVYKGLLKTFYRIIK